MKKALIVIAVLFVLAASVVFYLAWNANSLIAKYKPDLERIASNALGSSVTLGKLEASVFPSARVRVDEFRIARDAQAKEGLTLKNLILNVRLMPLLSGNLEIVKLGLDSPSLTFIKDKDGISIEGLPKKPAADPAASTTTAAGAAPKAQDPKIAAGGPVPAGLGLNLEKFELTNARITLKDVEAKKEFHVTNLNVGSAVGFANNVARISSLLVTGRLLDKIDFRVDGEPITYNLADGRFDLAKISVSTLGGKLDIQASGAVPTNSGKAHIDSSGFDLSKLAPAYDIAPALKDFALRGSVLPKIDAEWAAQGAYKANGTVSLTGIGATAATIVVSDLKGLINLNANQAAQNVSSKDLAFKLGSEPATLSFEAQMANNQASLQKLLLSALGGTVEASSNLNLLDQHFSAQYNVNTIAIDRAVAVLKPELGALVAGTVQNVKGNIAGALGPDLKQSMTGNTYLLVKDGSIKGINLAADVLKSVKDLPFLAGSLYSSAPPAQRAALESPDTAVGSLSGNFAIANAALNTQDFAMLSSLFSLNARGTIGFDTNINLNAQIGFDPSLSSALVTKTPQLKALQDSNERIVIPLSLQGIAPKILVLPDMQKLLELAANAAVKEGASKLLDSVLKGGAKEGGKKKGLGGLLGF